MATVQKPSVKIRRISNTWIPSRTPPWGNGLGEFINTQDLYLLISVLQKNCSILHQCAVDRKFAASLVIHFVFWVEPSREFCFQCFVVYSHHPSWHRATASNTMILRNTIDFWLRKTRTFQDEKMKNSILPTFRWFLQRQTWGWSAPRCRCHWQSTRRVRSRVKRAPETEGRRILSKDPLWSRLQRKQRSRKLITWGRWGTCLYAGPGLPFQTPCWESRAASALYNGSQGKSNLLKKMKMQWLVWGWCS